MSDLILCLLVNPTAKQYRTSHIVLIVGQSIVELVVCCFDGLVFVCSALVFFPEKNERRIFYLIQSYERIFEITLNLIDETLTREIQR